MSPGLPETTGLHDGELEKFGPSFKIEARQEIFPQV
jgi:hypothetical protein